MHDTLFGYRLPDFTQELISLRLTALGATEKPVFVELPFMGEDATPAVKGKRPIYYEGKWYEVPIYAGPRLGNGNRVAGPDIVEEPTTTILVPGDWQLTCDRFGNYLVYREGVSLKESFRQIGVTL
ncbi:MAG: hypothetical protein EHM36_05755 [Deltaproteobacteria bacterium]|nr:MAG: hypothetical protein EHM36_05755 [Deltaproteobacteria bacterium]